MAVRRPGRSRLSCRPSQARSSKRSRAVWSWSPEPGVAPVRLLLALLLARCRRSGSCGLARAGGAATCACGSSPTAATTRASKRSSRCSGHCTSGCCGAGGTTAHGQPSVSLELHHSTGRPHSVWLAIACPRGWERACEAALQATYPNCRLCPMAQPVGAPPVVLRLKKHAEFIKRVKVIDSFERRHEPPVNRLLTAYGRLRRAGVRADRDHAHPRAVRGLRQASVQAPRGSPVAAASSASPAARSLDAGRRRAARRSGGPAPAAVLRRPSRHRRHSHGL